MVRRLSLVIVAAAALLAAGTRTARASDPGTAVPACDLTSATPWVERWFNAWDLTSREILHIPTEAPPYFVFYDSLCVYTTSAVSAAGAAPIAGPRFQLSELPWRAVAHDDSIRLPDSTRLAVQLMTFAGGSKEHGGVFFVMGSPTFWKSAGHGQEPGLTAVFLHEFAHTRQIPGMAAVMGPLDSAWTFPEPLSDDVVQLRFGRDSTYVAEYLAERDLLYEGARTGTDDEARALAAKALGMMRARHARWFVDADSVFAALDDTFLSLEGAGQWTGQAWLAHPQGGGLTGDEAVSKMLGRRRWWSQDEGLALFLLVDRLVPEWPSMVFRVPSAGAIELLERAVKP
ncbi:MAG TPA: hypothetical protein VF720_03630 [Candidatus Eisenbacteria bacterium]